MGILAKKCVEVYPDLKIIPVDSGICHLKVKSTRGFTDH
jgi:hypothetical protein